jgi:hypothetical protein
MFVDVQRQVAVSPCLPQRREQCSVKKEGVIATAKSGPHSRHENPVGFASHQYIYKANRVALWVFFQALRIPLNRQPQTAVTCVVHETLRRRLCPVTGLPIVNDERAFIGLSTPFAC